MYEHFTGSSKVTLYHSHGHYQAAKNLQELAVLTVGDELKFQARPFVQGDLKDPVVVTINVSQCKLPQDEKYWFTPNTLYRYAGSETPFFSIKIDDSDVPTFTECIRLSWNDDAMLEVELCDLEGAWNQRDPFKPLEIYEVSDSTPAHEWFERHGIHDFQESDYRTDEENNRESRDVPWLLVSKAQEQTLQYYRPVGFTDNLTAMPPTQVAGPATKKVNVDMETKEEKTQMSILDLPAELFTKFVPFGQRCKFMQTSASVKEKVREKLPIRITSKPHHLLPNIISQIIRCNNMYTIEAIRISNRGHEGIFEFDRRGLQEPQTAQALAHALALCSSLRKLQLDYDKINSDVMGELAVGLQKCTLLTDLLLFGNEIEDVGLSHLVHALPHCASLSSLDLNANKFGENGVIQLAAVLPQCTSLTHLNLSNNAIGSEAMWMLTPALALCPKLSHLNLSFCIMYNYGLAFLNRVLPQCRSLTVLNIQWIGIDHQAVEQLVHALEQCPSLNYVNIKDNEIGEEGRRLLLALERRTKGLRIEIYGGLQRYRRAR